MVKSDAFYIGWLLLNVSYVYFRCILNEKKLTNNQHHILKCQAGRDDVSISISLIFSQI